MALLRGLEQPGPVEEVKASIVVLPSQRSGRMEYSSTSKKLPESAITLRLKQLNIRRSSVISIESKESHSA